MHLSTVHRVKGREWPCVVVARRRPPGCFPHRLADDEEEERRVFHVAVTRGRERVVVLGDAAAPSPFLEQLTVTAPPVPAGFVPPSGPPKAGRAKDRRAAPAADAAPLSPRGEAARATLVAWRSALAKAEGKPAYVYLTNASITDITQRDPDTLAALARCTGIGPAKLEAYGEAILGLLEELEVGREG